MERNADFQREVGKEVNKIKRKNANLRNNAIIDKLIENWMNKIDVKIVTIRKQYFK